MKVKQCSVMWCLSKINKENENQKKNKLRVFLIVMQRIKLKKNFFIACVDPHYWYTASSVWLKAHLKISIWFFSLWCTLWCAAQVPSCWVAYAQVSVSYHLLQGLPQLEKAVSPRWQPFSPWLTSNDWSLKDDFGLASSAQLGTTLRGHSTSRTFHGVNLDCLGSASQFNCFLCQILNSLPSFSSTKPKGMPY